MYRHQFYNSHSPADVRNRHLRDYEVSSGMAALSVRTWVRVWDWESVGWLSTVKHRVAVSSVWAAFPASFPAISIRHVQLSTDQMTCEDIVLPFLDLLSLKRSSLKMGRGSQTPPRHRLDP